ncbi:YdaU family protein [Bartonella acomydis]|uniref:Phage related protein n=1 Tax=Bartonella acomydis TaxID=686234 RepID=A0ABP9MX08_9HYPH
MKQTNQQATPYYESSRLPYVCWYQNDFLGGVRGMRAHEIGIYTILLNEMYARGRPLELSVERLARLCGCDKRTFTNVLEMLIEEGKILNLAHGLWNKRCETVFQERAKFLEQKSFAGHCSAKKRKKINAEIQRLLNNPDRDDAQSSQAQKEEEKETPYGVSEKSFFLLTTEPFAGDDLQEDSSATSTPHAPIAPNTPAPGKQILSSPAEGQHAPLTTPRLNATSTPHAPSASATSSTANRQKQAKSRTVIAKGQRLPKDWQADIGAAILEGLNEEQARWQEKKFRDYWQAKSGREALKVDWQATWRNWFRREIERLKEHQERLAIFSSQNRLSAPNGENEALYRSLINYHTN